MPSIHKQPGPTFLVLRIHDLQSRNPHQQGLFRSTKTRVKKQALETCRAWHKAERSARGVSDVFTAANVESQREKSTRVQSERFGDSFATTCKLLFAASKESEQT
jgi:hypothetical protein